ncbi:MAG TPA: hypothetical protein VIV60_30695, partial [Polyangiaceae bacterium]
MQLYDAQKSLSDIGRQFIKLSLDSPVQDLNPPGHEQSLYQKRDYVQRGIALLRRRTFWSSSDAIASHETSGQERTTFMLRFPARRPL